MSEEFSFSLFPKKGGKIRKDMRKDPFKSSDCSIFTAESKESATPVRTCDGAPNEPSEKVDRQFSGRAGHHEVEFSREELGSTISIENVEAPVTGPDPQTAEREPQPLHTEERRRKRRALISAPVRVRSFDVTGEDAADEVTTTVNISRIGILIETANPGFYRSMPVAVTLPYSHSPAIMQAEQPAHVVRISQSNDGRYSVAIALDSGKSDELVNAKGDIIGRELDQAPDAEKSHCNVTRDPGSPKPLVLVLEAEAEARNAVRSYLSNEGYDVITVCNSVEAKEVLAQHTPSLVIAEIEGEGMPGYDLCTHCKATPRLRNIPVMLMTSSAYPSDYSSAHSLGAVVCMAKPFKQERLGHVVRLLAPPPYANECAPPRPIDPSRRTRVSRPNNLSGLASRRFGVVNK